MRFIKVVLLSVLAVVITGCASNGAIVVAHAKRTSNPSQIIDHVYVTWDDHQAIHVETRAPAWTASDFVSGVTSEFRDHAVSEISRRLAMHGVGSGPDVLQMKLIPLNGSFGSTGGYVDIGVSVGSTRSAVLPWKTTIRVHGKFGVDKALLLSSFADKLIEELVASKLIL